ncbi:MAG: Fic family protein [Clostridia bacterium]|nr:Fic family protein [Clostridia bacterium]
MIMLNVKETAKKWGISERSVRDYCNKGTIEGAILEGKTWLIPESARKPMRQNAKISNLLSILRQERQAKVSGGIYHQIQIDLTYNSNHIEGSTLSHDQTRYIYETNTVGIENVALKVDDIVETVNHFRCVDYVIDNATKPLSESFVKALHKILKSGTKDSYQDWFAIGEYKKLPNTVGGKETTSPSEVKNALKELISSYNAKPQKTLDDLLDFHYKFERIHPFQDGNGRVGRLVLFKECLKHKIVPFIIDENLKIFYYRGLNEWSNERGFLRETCSFAQDKFKNLLNYFNL